MFEMDTSSLMSGEGKPPAACRSRPSALPRLYAWMGRAATSTRPSVGSPPSRTARDREGCELALAALADVTAGVHSGAVAWRRFSGN
jgi:hypothetical protein